MMVSLALLQLLGAQLQQSAIFLLTKTGNYSSVSIYFLKIMIDDFLILHIYNSLFQFLEWIYFMVYRTPFLYLSLLNFMIVRKWVKSFSILFLSFDVMCLHTATEASRYNVLLLLNIKR